MLLLHRVRQSHAVGTEDRSMLVYDHLLDVESVRDGLVMLVFLFAVGIRRRIVQSF